MPYIQQYRRKEVEDKIPDHEWNCGELNYSITTLLINYWNAHDQKYQIINDIIGALEGAKAEFQRRVVAPYEDQKIIQNGDVY